MGILPSLNYQSTTETWVGSKKKKIREAARRGGFYSKFPFSLSSGGSCETAIAKKKAGNKCVLVKSHLQPPIIAPSGSSCCLLPNITVIFCFLWQSGKTMALRSGCVCALTGINHTPFTSHDLPVFFIETYFISKGEGGQIKQTPSSSPCLHIVLDNSNASEMSQHLLSEISFIFEVEERRWRRKLCCST